MSAITSFQQNQRKCFNPTCPNGVNQRVFACAECRFAMYCNHTCQAQDLPRHKVECITHKKKAFENKLDNLKMKYHGCLHLFIQRAEEISTSLNAATELLSQDSTDAALLSKVPSAIQDLKGQIAKTKTNYFEILQLNNQLSTTSEQLVSFKENPSTLAWAKQSELEYKSCKNDILLALSAYSMALKNLSEQVDRLSEIIRSNE